MSDFLGLKNTVLEKYLHILTEDLKNTFSKFLKQNEIPNLLLLESQSTRNKTTVARALCEELNRLYNHQWFR